MNLVTQYFEENFVVDELPPSSAKWQLEIIRALNADEELDRTETESPINIAINIAGTALTSGTR